MANVGPSQEANKKISLNWSKPAMWKTGKVIVCSQAPTYFRYSSSNLTAIARSVFPISLSVPLLKDILQKLNTTLALETMGVH